MGQPKRGGRGWLTIDIGTNPLTLDGQSVSALPR
jgi:hypothetical protein